eukprot:CAMPEP_0201481554 /NCGR_PEP_ID=MMETSP0151_2-20130828/5826_1 /ASSEMBLY_ACC=CAM_ASM_000257 /TAXON_ID=200890 /ORGANISM="Paramoeba atlantica, Strain 621/1 / CCAP 1560/9" /LENGTH=543 /DNA_ID=CAMNT_0047863819 /DNA_START=36 /DNA_END=1667 /DNA_ORIENTATION=+
MVIALIDVVSVAGAGSGSFLFSNMFLFVLLFLFSATTTLFISYPPSYLKKKFEMYQMSKKLFVEGESFQNLTHLDMAGRLIKHTIGCPQPIVKNETAVKSSVDVASVVLGTDDIEVIEKYWTYSPGITFDQKPDGYHVHVKGDDHECVLMSSLSYWGFHVNEEVREYAFDKVRQSGTGNHGSYLLLGKNTVVDEAYDRMKTFFKREYCSFSASGFLACMNLVANLCPKGGLIFLDEKCHVCLRYGSKLTGAKVIKFPHQNYDALEKLMKEHRHKYSGRVLLVVDSIYSADGTIANLPRARELCDKFNAEIVMDEAHSLGSLGATGHGIEEHFDMYGACDFICGVFSKTLSSYGGFVVSNKPDVKVLTITPGVGFATGPHSFSAATVSKALEIIERDNGKVRAEINDRRSFYVNELKTVAKCANIIHCGHNVFVSYPHLFAATTVAVEMRKRGYLISAFMFPSVPLDRSILRLTVTPLMTREILSGFCKTLGECMSDLARDRFGDEVMFGKHKKQYYDELHPADDRDEEEEEEEEVRDEGVAAK